MTEDEAKTKWCHKMLPRKAADPEANWGWDGKCIGSACMAWRWHGVGDQYRLGYEPRPGHCGLAGKP